MTALPSPVPEETKTPVLVEPPADSELGQLHAAYDDAKTALESAKERYDTLANAIKLRLAEAAPGERRVHLVGPFGPALAMTYSESQRLDTKAIKPVVEALCAQDPTARDRLYKTSGSWSLRPVGGQG